MQTLVVLLIFNVICVYSTAYSRSDLNGNALSSSEGIWGDWGSQYVYCDAGQYAIGYKLNVEPPINGDDTAANSFCLICDGGSIIYTSNWDDALWGSWAAVLCPSGEFIKGFKSKVEAGQGNGDDTALNSIKILCTDESEKETYNAGPWGDWGTMAQCGSGSVVCGMNQKIEKKGGDDTSLNAVSLRCCDNTKVFSDGNGYWDLVFGSGGGAQIEKEVTIGITDHSESSFTEENSQSLELALSASMSFSYMGVGDFVITSKLTTAQSSTVTSTSLHGVTKSIEEKWKMSCEAGDEALYQYVTSVRETGANQATDIFKIKSKSYWCVSDSTLKPKCPFYYCKGDDCQECTVVIS
eukprot:46724_1